MSQLKLALRSLTKTPFVTAVAVLSLGLGVGANAAIFSLFDQILLIPLPVEAPEQLVNLGAPGPHPGSTSCSQAGDCQEIFSYPMFRDLERAQSGFSGIAAHVGFGANLLLARGAARGQEMAIRGSLGAGRHHLLVQLLTESFLLATLGGAASLFVAQATLGLIGTFLPRKPPTCWSWS